MWAIEYLKTEWASLRAAPLAFIVLLLIGFAGGMYLRSEQVENAESRVKLRDDQIQVRDERINALEKTISDGISAGPKSVQELSPENLKLIKEILSAAPSKIGIVNGGKAPAMFVGQIKDVFSTSGWDIQSVQSRDTANSIILKAPDKQSSDAVRKALEGVGMKYLSVDYANPTGSMDFFVAAPNEK
jgi:hypothetical protein